MLLLLALACAPKEAPAAHAEVEDVAVAGVADPALRALLHDHWERTMARSPVWATMLGDHRFDAELGDYSADAIAEDRVARRAFLERARALSPAS